MKTTPQAERAVYYDQKIEFYSGLNRPLVQQIEQYLGGIKKQRSEIRILDVGCGPGTLGAYLRQQGYMVWGVDISSVAIEKAKTQLDAAYVLDIEKEKPAFKDQKFDLIIFADILEHTYSPDQVLRIYQAYLQPQAAVAISLPNIANYTIRLKLLSGRFDYQSHGIMDDTHIRFFTKKTLFSLLDEVGMQVVQWGVSANNRFEGNSLLYPVERWLTKHWPTFLGYQLIVIARQKRA